MFFRCLLDAVRENNQDRSIWDSVLFCNELSLLNEILERLDEQDGLLIVMLFIDVAGKMPSKSGGN